VKTISTTLVVFAALYLLHSTVVKADIITLNAFARGWITDSGSANGSSATNNYLVGNCPSSGLCGGEGEYRNWFQFAIPAQLGSVQSAVLTLSAAGIGLNQSPSIIYSVTSLSSSFTFGDLGTGTFYGSRTYTAADLNTTTQIAFDADAINNLANGGVFGVGGRVTSPTQFGLDFPEQIVFGGSDLGGVAQLVITTSPVPLPAAVWLLGSGLIGLFSVLNRDKRKRSI
jgi:hypothetical protein